MIVDFIQQVICLFCFICLYHFFTLLKWEINFFCKKKRFEIIFYDKMARKKEEFDERYFNEY